MTSRERRPPWLWARWIARDFRHHGPAVIAIGLVVAIGTGVFAGLGSTATWRRESNDESFAALSVHDLEVRLSPGTFTSEGALAAAVRGIDDASALDHVVERLVVDSQIDASSGGDTVLVAARLVGMRIDEPQAVDALWISSGSVPPAGTAGAILEAKFADIRGLDSEGTIIVAGDRRLQYTGLGMTPEDFWYEGPEGTVFAEGELAPVYLPLADAQAVVARPDQVNDVVLTLVPGADRDLVEAQLTETFASIGVSATVTNQDEIYAVRVLYDDIENDQLMWNAIAGLVLVAASLAAFNLVSRIVEAQRREIGIGMALGVHPARLAIRPMIVGVEVAVLGTAAGIGVGLWVGQQMESLLVSFLPLPEYRITFQTGIFVRAAVFGLVPPIVASALPVWNAVRVEPIKAIRTGHLAARSSRWTGWTAGVRIPASTKTTMPLRNIVRTPRRTLLTAAGVGAAVTALVGVLGLLDSLGRTVDRAGDELTKGDPERVLVQLDTFHPEDSDVVGAIHDHPASGETAEGLRMPARAVGVAAGHEDEIDLVLELLDLDNATWTPTLVATTETPESGIVLARKAADDLDVDVGDSITLQHLIRFGPDQYGPAVSELSVTAIHASPIRVFAFMDISQAERFGLSGVVNLIHVNPAPGADRTDVQRAVFTLDGVASSQAVARVSESFDEALAEFVGILAIAGGAVSILAVLISFNATRITMDERRREHATMRAFGLPVRSVMATVIKESVVIGIAATLIGLAAALGFLRWMLQLLATTTLPDLQVDLHLASTTVTAAVMIGTFTVAASPLLLVRKLLKMDIPDTLRVME